MGRSVLRLRRRDGRPGWLIFVAVALNHEQILNLASLPPFAARSVGVLLALLVECVLGLAPGQSIAVLGVETLMLGVFVLVLVVVSTLHRHPGVVLRYRVAQLVIAVLSTVPLGIAGMSLLLGRGGSQYWVLAGLVSGSPPPSTAPGSCSSKSSADRTFTVSERPPSPRGT